MNQSCLHQYRRYTDLLVKQFTVQMKQILKFRQCKILEKSHVSPYLVILSCVPSTTIIKTLGNLPPRTWRSSSGRWSSCSSFSLLFSICFFNTIDEEWKHQSLVKMLISFQTWFVFAWNLSKGYWGSHDYVHTITWSLVMCRSLPK